ncbi:hypothetical protein FQR65_LT00466 [Abscondita terminalis]|nr:hypothetical protein FQR65_LT00466 [Abscondita terminalis]
MNTVLYITLACALTIMGHDQVMYFGSEISRCICATGVEPELAYQWLYKYKLPNDPCLKCFLKCVAVGVYIYDNDGTFHKDIMMNVMQDFTESEIDAQHHVSYFESEMSRCICATGVKQEFANQWLYQNKFVNDACFKCFIKCVLMGVGRFDSDGTINSDVMLSSTSQLSETEIQTCSNETANETIFAKRRINLLSALTNYCKTEEKRELVLIVW